MSTWKKLPWPFSASNNPILVELSHSKNARRKWDYEWFLKFK